MRRSSIKCQKLKTLKKCYKKILLGATKIEDLAGELKNSTFFSVAPPSLILCAKPLQAMQFEPNGRWRASRLPPALGFPFNLPR